MPDSIQTVIDQTLAACDAHAATLSQTPAVAMFQWPWDIAKAGAELLGRHGNVISGLAKGGSSVATSSAGPGIVDGIKASPEDAANTSKVLDDSLFGPALDSIKADDLLRTVFIGFGGGGQVGIAGGSGASGVAYDIVDSNNRAAVSFSEFDLGIGAKVGAGLTIGAMSDDPRSLNHSTNLWSFGASLVVGVFVQVIMRSSDLGLVGFAVNVGAGGGAASSVGYGSISAS